MITANEAHAYDGALAALALVEATVDDNRVNRNNILATTDAGQLVIGFVLLVGGLRESLAAETGSTVEEISELFRSLYTAASQGAIG